MNPPVSDNVKDLPQVDYSSWVSQTRYDGNGQPYTVRVPQGTPNYTQPKVSTTTISNGNKMDQVPGIVNTFNKLSDTGVRTDPSTGIATYANGSPYQEQKLQTADTSVEDAAFQKNLDDMKAQTDAQTADMIAAIQRKYEQRRQEQAEINARQKKAYQTTLLTGGVTGSGSSAQYAPISSDGIIGAQESYGLKQIADLDAEEQNLIAQAKAAQTANNFKLLEAKNTQIQQTRQAKLAATQKLNDSIIEQNQKLREQNQKSALDSAISSLYSNGTTNVPDILNQLKEKGYSATSSDVATSLKNIANTEDINKVLTEAAKNGATPDVLAKIGAAKNLTDALSNAGSFMSSPNTEIVKLGDNQAYLIDKKTGKIIKSFGGGIGGSGTGNGSVNSGKYSGVIKTILGSGKFTKEQSNAITSAIANGDDPATVIKNNAKTIMTAPQATDTAKYETAKASMTDIKNALQQYYEKGGDTGIFSGSYEKAINKLGQVNNPELVELAVQIASGLQIYRNAVSGTAYSVKEGQEISSIFPGINKSKGLNDAIIKGRMKAFDSTIDGNYKSVLGKSYDDLVKTQNTGFSKGTLSDRDFVAKAFSENGQNYTNVVNSTPKGQIPVIDNESGQIGYIPYTEFNSTKYTKV